MKVKASSCQNQVAQKVPDARRRGARNEAYSSCTPQLRVTMQMGLFEAPLGKPQGASKPNEVSVSIRSLDPATSCGDSLAMCFQRPEIPA